MVADAVVWIIVFGAIEECAFAEIGPNVVVNIVFPVDGRMVLCKTVCGGVIDGVSDVEAA